MVKAERVNAPVHGSLMPKKSLGKMVITYVAQYETVMA